MSLAIELREFKAFVPDNRSTLISSKYHVLSPWTEIISMFNVFIVDQDGFLTYKNRLTKSDPEIKQALNDGIRKKPDSLL